MAFGVESSAELLRRARGGDEAAWDRLCSQHRRWLQVWARGRLPARLRGVIDTDDLVQDTLLRTLGHVRDFEPRHEGALHGYLREALTNRIREEARRAARRPGIEPLEAEVLDQGPSPLEKAVGRENLDRYEAALSRMRPEDREAVVMRIELGLSHDEIARALGKPSADAARMATSRALVRLAEDLARE